MNLPNKLSLARVLSIPVMLYLISQRQFPAFLSGYLLAILIGLTDFLDGFLARRYQWVTNLGKFLDPIADKIFIIALLIYVTFHQIFPLWLLILILAREFAVSDLRLFALHHQMEVSVSTLGKTKALSQYLLLFMLGYFRICTVYSLNYPDTPLTPPGWLLLSSQILMMGVAILTFVSMAEYFWKAKKLFT